MRTLDDYYREVLWKTNLTTNDFPYKYTGGGAYGFIQAFAKIYKLLVQEVVQAGSNYFLEKSTIDLVANTEEYYFPSDLCRLRYIEIAMDGTNFYKAQEFDPSFFVMSEQGTVSTASETSPQIWIMGSINTPSSHFQVAPRPKIAKTGGIKIYYDRMPSALLATPVSAAMSTASTQVYFPAQFEELITDGICNDIWTKYGELDKHAQEINDYKQGVEDMKRLLKPRINLGQKRIRDIREIG